MLANAIFPATASVSQHFPVSAPAASSGPWKWKWACETCVGTTVAHLHSAFCILQRPKTIDGTRTGHWFMACIWCSLSLLDCQLIQRDELAQLCSWHPYEQGSHWLSLVNHSSCNLDANNDPVTVPIQLGYCGESWFLYAISLQGLPWETLLIENKYLELLVIPFL